MISVSWSCLLVLCKLSIFFRSFLYFPCSVKNWETSAEISNYNYLFSTSPFRCRFYFEVMFLSAFAFRIVGYSWWLDPSVITNYLLTFSLFLLKVYLLDNISMPPFLWLLLTWHAFPPHLFAFKLCIFNVSFL